jgi:myo-inositol-1(or 4)-monophosphatase
MSEIEQLQAFSLTLAEVAGAAILPHFRKATPVDNKLSQGWDPVTAGDKDAEIAIRAQIEKHFPTHGIIGEEFGTKAGSSAYTWVLDPIDGTRAFVIGIPTWATLIGLYKDGKPFMGVMCQPHVGETFYGGPQGAFLRHGSTTTRLRCAANKPIASALAGTTSPHLFKNQGAIEALRQRVQLLRYGGDAYFFALVAAGHLDIALDAGLQIYDVAALIPIIRGAGAIVGTWDGKDESQGGNILAASSQQLFESAQAVLNGAA